MKVHTESVQFKADQKLLDFVERKVNKLEQFFDRIIDVEVKLRLENSGQVKDKVAEVRLQVPGQSLFAKETNKTFEQSIDKAVDDLRRQLTKYKEKLRPHNGISH
ncbi:MAG: ribosome-associated translation inhibitor RaiA [Lewinellaceae bacterium]|nr:ribosome-associated translation inhibitor RaiA [Saprospiraceae bacterium]MCB9339689.1 ribosome-associated translation inhibitor RaiA [Lewinellaceae bacterium]